jgi:hypothetical protein
MQKTKIMIFLLFKDLVFNVSFCKNSQIVLIIHHAIMDIRNKSR